MGNPKKHLRQSLLLSLSLLFLARPVGAEVLYVFYPAPMRSQVMQKKLNDTCPGVDITVFGRYKDFRAKVGMDGPDAILTKLPVIEHTDGYSPRLRGSRNGKTEEGYVLLSADRKMDPAALGGVPVGVFDILGRTGMKTFVARHFPSPPKLKRVSKMEDLLHLMTLNMAKAVLIPEKDVAYFKEMSRLDFVLTPVPEMRVGIVALGVRDGKHASMIVKRLSGMDDKNKALLDIDDWREE